MKDLDRSKKNMSPSRQVSPSHHKESAARAAYKTRAKQKMRTREKIEKMVADGAKNYPAYLKLIYTGESDFSSEDEAAGDRKCTTGSPAKKPQTLALAGSGNLPKTGGHEGVMMDTGDKAGCSKQSGAPGGGVEDEGEEILLNTPGDAPQQQEQEEKPKTGSQKTKDETFYDTSEIHSPDYENAMNQSQLPEDPVERARLQEEWRTDLAKLEDEITTLQSVLSVKVRHASDLKKKLGLTPMAEFKNDFKTGVQTIRDSSAYRRTSEQLTKVNSAIHSSQAYQKTSGAFKSFGQWSSRKMGDLKSSNAYKSFEESVGGAYSNVKTKVSGSKSENDFEEVLNSTASERDGDSGAAAGTPTGNDVTQPEKVPL